MAEYQKLTTVKQIVDAVNEKNIDCFIADFKMFLEFHIETRKVDFSKMPGLEGCELNTEKAGEDFRWCDDGETGCKGMTINIETKP